MADSEYIKKIKVGSTDYNIQAALADVASKTTGILTLTGAATGTFNGSGNTTINIPTISGPTGAIGPIGPTGLQGLKGNTGNTGPTGPTGSVASLSTSGSGSLVTGVSLNSSTKVLTISKSSSLYSYYMTFTTNSSTTLGGAVVARFITSGSHTTGTSMTLAQLAAVLYSKNYKTAQASCLCTGAIKLDSAVYIAIGIYATSTTSVYIVATKAGDSGTSSLKNIAITNASGMYSIYGVSQTL